MPCHAATRPSSLHAIPISDIPTQSLHCANTLHVPFHHAIGRSAFSNASGNVIGTLKRVSLGGGSAVLGGKKIDEKCSDAADEFGKMLATIENLHSQLKDNYKIRWELDRYLLALHYGAAARSPPIPIAWMILELSDTYHYYNLPDLAHIIRSTFMGSCCAPWLQKLFNIFLCGKRYRRLINTSHTTCQLTAAIINTLHGLLLGLYPFNERRTEIQERAWLAGTVREALTDTQHTLFINKYPHLLCLSLAEYIINVIDDFCPIEWVLLSITTSAKSQCLASFETFRESSIRPAIRSDNFWDRLESDAQPVVSSLVKFFRGATFYQHKPKTILPVSSIQYLPLALGCRVIQNSSSIFGQLKAAMHDIQFKESEALEEIWTSICIRPLPTHTTLKQMETLNKTGKMCSLVEREMHHFPLCVACALTKRIDILRGMFRYDSIDECLVCNECSRHTYVVDINMLGRVLYIKDKTVVLCERCMQPKYWDNTCACTAEDTSTARSCCACVNSNIISVKEVIDLDNMVMKPMHFCYKHSLSCILNPATIYDMRSLQQEICSRQTCHSQQQ